MPRRHHRHLKEKPKDWIDYAIYFFVFATPLFELPQAYEIYVNKSSADVSILTWGFFLIASFFWLIYASKHKMLPFIITYSLYLVVEIVIVTGIIMYR